MPKTAGRNNWVDYLRSFITVLVVAHHSSLAYTTFAHFNKAAYIASTHPVVDTARSRGLDIFEDFNDIFFMPLMFLISGLFVTSGLQNKGVKVFIRGRFYRLFIPFMVGVTALMLLAYYPAWYLATGRNDMPAYVIDFFTTEAWPVGPPWFIWVLFLFNLAFALCWPVAKPFINRLSAFIASKKQRPITIFPGWYLLTWVLYVPIVLMVEPGTWTGIGPFDFQVSRLLLYFAYFVLGAVLGAPGLENSIFSTTRVFVKRWPIWVIACVGVYALLKLSEAPLGDMLARHQLTPYQARVIYRSVWALSCTLSCMAFLTMFKSLFNKYAAWWHNLAANAYGIYLVHYIFVLWCQYLLLGFSLPAVVKFLTTFIVSVAVSWLVVWLARKNKIIARYM
jgi:hypothetical protein